MRNCRTYPHRGFAILSPSWNWLLNKIDRTPQNDGYLPAGYVIAERSIKIEGTWTMSPQSQPYLSTEVAASEPN